MATENVGGIQYTVDADTAAMLKAEAVVKKSSTNMSNSLKGADNSVKQFNASATKASSGVKKAFGSNLGQAGIQVQQFAGQLQGGQSAMVALAQQSADLGIVLGAPLIGVFVSLAAVLAGTLAPAIFGSVSNIEKLQKAIENTKAIMTIGANGIAEYTEEMKKLNTASEALAKIKIAIAMTENAEAMKSASKEALSLSSSLFGFQEYATDAAERLTGLTSKAGEIQNLSLAMKSFNSAASDKKKLIALDRAEKALLALRKGGVFPTKKLQEYAQEFFTFSDSARQAIANNKALASSQDELGSSTSDVTDKVKTSKEALQTQIIALNSGERAALKFSLLLEGLNANQIDEILTLYDKKKALEETIEKTKEATEANEKYDKSVRDKTESDLTWYEQQLARMKQGEKDQTAKLTTQVQSVGLTPEQEIQARYDAEIELLRRAEEKKIEIEGTYADRRTQLEKERLESVRALQSDNNEFLEAAFGNLDTQIAGTMAQVVTGAKDGEEALSALANTILTQVIGAVVQWGIAEVSKLFTVESAETGIKAANAAATTASVSAQVGMNSILAAQNAFMATAAIPFVGPMLAPAAAAAAGAASGAIGASAIPLAPIAGAREFGGPVTAGKSYLVGERGPEMFTPGSSGGITSNKDMASGGQMNVIINNNAAGVDVSANQIDQRTVEISVRKSMQEFANQASTGQGVAINALTRNTNVTRKGGV